MHNHPNNSSFSNRDVVWFAENDVSMFSQIGNNGKAEIIIKSSDFDYNRFTIAYKRLLKKHNTLIAKDKALGYNKVMKDLLKNNKAGFILIR